MGKERIENLKSTIKLIKDNVDANTHHFETLALATEIIINHGEWLIEQAERVQGLENENWALRTVAESNKYVGEQYLEQNKRYREAIEFAKLKIKDFETDVKMIWKMAEDKIIKRDARQVLDDIADTLEALEGEE